MLTRIDRLFFLLLLAPADGGSGGGDPSPPATPPATPPAPGATATPPAAPPAAPPATPPVPAGGDPPDWRAGLPDDLRQHPAVAKFTSAEALARSYINAETMIGRDKIVVPKDASDAEAYDRAYAALGRPENADGYEFKPPENLPDGVQVDEQLLGLFRASAHKAGLNQAQFDSTAGMFLEYLTQGVAAAESASQNALKEGEASLRQEFGERYDATLRTAREAVRYAGGDELVKFLDDSGLGSHPAVVKAFAKIGAEVAGDEALHGARQDPGMTPANLDSAISEFRAKYAAALGDKMHPDHGRLVEELQRLYQRRYPEPSA